MQEDVSFGELYKKLMDSNFDPDPDLAGNALSAILRRLSSQASQAHETASVDSTDDL